MLTFPEIDPVALQIGPLAIRWYGLSYVVGIVVAWWLLRRRARGTGTFSEEQVGDLIFYGALGVIIGGRLGSVLFYNLPYYLDHPLAVFKIWEGGMSFHGGLLGVLAALAWTRRRFGRSFLEITDFAAPAMPVGFFTGRLGNFVNGELWGRPTDLPWGMVFPAADGQARHPSQLYEALLEGAVLFAVLWWFSRRPRPTAAVSGLFLSGYGVLRGLVEFVREPDGHLGFQALGWVTRGQLLCVPMIVAGVALLLWAYRPRNTLRSAP